MHEIRTLEALEALYGEVGEASRLKEIDYLHPVYQQWIQASPLLFLATEGPEGIDLSPRGDPAPVVKIQDTHTLLLPERRGNNRIDSLRNLLHNPQVGLIFMIPGVAETLRIKGEASISVEPALLETFRQQGKLPHCVLRIQVRRVFFQCGRALLRSSLWTETQRQARPAVPTAGAILAALSSDGGSVFDGEGYDQALPDRLKQTLY